MERKKAVVQKDCQARNLNKEDAMEHGRWKKLKTTNTQTKHMRYKTD